MSKSTVFLLAGLLVSLGLSDIGSALSAEPPSWAGSRERALLEELTLGDDRVSVLVDCVGRWRFEEMEPAGDLPLSAKVVSEGRQRSPSEQFELHADSGAWAMLRASPSDDSVRAYCWEGGRHHAVLREDYAAAKERNLHRVIIRDEQKVVPAPFSMLHLGYLLLAEGFPADAASIDPSDSLATTLDAAGPTLADSAGHGTARWVATHEARGRFNSLVKEYEVLFRTSCDGDLAIESLTMASSARNHAGEVLRKYSKTFIRFAGGWSDASVLTAGGREMYVLRTVYDERGTIKYSTYDVSRIATIPDRMRLAADQPVNIASVLGAVAEAWDGEIVFEVVDRTMGLEYQLGSPRVRFEGRIHNFNEEIAGILSPQDWVSLVARQDWSDK